MKIYFLVLSVPILATICQIFIKLGMQQIGEITLTELKNNPLSLILSIITNVWVLMAAPLYTASFILWMYILSKLNLSFAYPFLALSFVLVPLVSLFVFGENISTLRWAGIFVIFSGIVIIGFSN